MVAVHLRNGEQKSDAFTALSANQTVPVLVDGDAVIEQSLAIIEYLNEIHPQVPLYPQYAILVCYSNLPIVSHEMRSIAACPLTGLQNHSCMRSFRFFSFTISDRLLNVHMLALWRS